MKSEDDHDEPECPRCHGRGQLHRSDCPEAHTPWGFDRATVELIFAIERLTREHGLSRAQTALASALWRATARHPSLASTVDFEAVEIRIHDGGRALSVQVRMFPPSPPISGPEGAEDSKREPT